MPNHVINNINMSGPQGEIDKVLDLIKNKNEEYDEAIDFNNVVPMPETLKLIEGGSNVKYIAAYVKTLPTMEQAELVAALLQVPASYYGNYYKKYAGAFNNEPLDTKTLDYMQEALEKDYSFLNPSCIEDVGKAYINNILTYGADTWYAWCVNNWGTKWNAYSSCIDYNSFGFDTAWSAALPITEKLSVKFPNVTFTHEYADEDIGSNCGRVVFKDGTIVEKYYPEKQDEAIVFACQIWNCDPSDYGVDDTNYNHPSLEESISKAKDKVIEPVNVKSPGKDEVVK